MSLPPEGSSSLSNHIQHLRYAAATTTCRATADALRRMLKEAEERARKVA